MYALAPISGDILPANVDRSTASWIEGTEVLRMFRHSDDLLVVYKKIKSD